MSPFDRSRGPWRRTAGYLNWLFNPLHGLDAPGIYELLSTSAATEQGLYLNLGYWQRAASIDEASEDLARLVAGAVRLGPGDRVLDCGFGFGDQDILWAQSFRPNQIVGLNITASQVVLARRRVGEAGLADRIDLREGSATAIPFDPASFDVVVALECAFHFRTRERFFQEAWRVLRPGGRLVTADIIPMDAEVAMAEGSRHSLSWRLVAAKFAIPPENAYPRRVYASKLTRSGFDTVQVESIREAVYAPLHRYLRSHPTSLRRLHPLAQLAARFALRFDADAAYRGLDYVLATAVKPVAAGQPAFIQTA
jgi:ubiquinone/menaquinone biosynthesis C-methylase UbiE